MFGWFTPDIISNSVYEIDFDALKKKHIKGLIFDIDNTLVSYNQAEPTDIAAAFLKNLTESGFNICFVSNNSEKRVEIFNSGLGYKFFAGARKPFMKYIKKALEAMGTPKENAALIGDQLFTDIAAAKRAKITAILVTPIEPVETMFFRVKRFLEKPFIKRYYRRQKKHDGK